MTGERRTAGGAGTAGTNGGGDVAGELERRYRRLLRWYPAEHRVRYEDEMVGMMLAGARPGQRWPGAGEAVNVLLFAVRTRLRRATPGLRDTRWSDAAAVAGVLLSMLLFAYRLRPALGSYAWSLRTDTPHLSLGILLPPGTWVPAVAALAVTAAVLAGRQAIAVPVGWAAVLGDVVMLVRGSRLDTQVSSVSRGWLLAATILVAAALSVPGTAGRARAILGWRRAALFAAACALLTLSLTVDPLLARVTSAGDSGYSVELWPKGGGYLPQIFPGDQSGTGLAPLLLYAVIIAMAITVVMRIAAPVRRRLLAVLSPAVVFFALTSVFFQNYAVAGAYFDHPLRLASPRWAVLVGMPVLAFLVALLLVRRGDRVQRLTAAEHTAMSVSTGSGDGPSRKRL
jgi:hypothetical protein